MRFSFGGAVLCAATVAHKNLSASGACRRRKLPLRDGNGRSVFPSGVEPRSPKCGKNGTAACGIGFAPAVGSALRPGALSNSGQRRSASTSQGTFR